MNILKKLRKKKPLSADVIALLAQAHGIHQAELEFAKDAMKAELRDKVRHALEGMQGYDKGDGRSSRSTADIQDDYLVTIGALFCDTLEQEREWHMYIRDRRIASNDAKFAILSQRIERAKKRTVANGYEPAPPVPYQEGENGTHASGGVVATW